MDFCKTKKSPARLWMLVVGVLLLGGGGAALLSSCDEMRALMGESDENPGDPSGGNEDKDSSTPKLTTLPQVEAALAAKAPVKLVIGAGHTFTWKELLDAIQAKAKTVALDISATTLAVDDGVFDPRYSGGTTPFGESFITKLTLPNAAEAIAGGESSNGIFANFTGLVEVSADKVATINSSAFRSTGKLEKAYFRAVESIGMQAFQDCPALADLYLPVNPPELSVSGEQTSSLFQNDSTTDGTLTIHVPVISKYSVWESAKESVYGSDNKQIVFVEN
jgi:hypothetical protein